MINRISRRNWISLFFAGILLTTSVIGAVVFSAKRHQPNRQQQSKRVIELPAVVSHVPKLEIENIRVKDPGTSDATAVIEIRNNADSAVMAVEISTKNGGDSAAVNEDGLDDADNPKVVIPPHGTTTLEMTFGEMIADAPIVVSAAVFSDGSEQGEKWSLDAMRGVRERRQLLRKTEKEDQWP